MKEFLEELKRRWQKGAATMLVTVVSKKGSAPGGMGMHMAVGEQGRLLGTIGGGAVEYRAEKTAVRLLEEKSSRLLDFSLTPGPPKTGQLQDTGMVCGGEMKVCFQYIGQESAHWQSLVNQALEAMERGEALWLETELAPDGEPSSRIIPRSRIAFPSVSGKAELVEQEGKCYYREPLLPEGRVYLFGGGHVARALVPLLARLSFRCVVMDDREEYARRKDFPAAERIICGDYGKLAQGQPVLREDFVIIMTRGHQYDALVAEQMLGTAARYIGIMGSRSKKAHMEEHLSRLGFGCRMIGRIRTPIGLDIGAVTPEEIAVSIAAQLIAVRNEGYHEAG